MLAKSLGDHLKSPPLSLGDLSRSVSAFRVVSFLSPRAMSDNFVICMYVYIYKGILMTMNQFELHEEVLRSPGDGKGCFDILVLN